MNANNTVRITGSVIRRTDKAILIRLPQVGDTWIPKSLITDETEVGSIAGTLEVFEIPLWLAIQKSIPVSREEFFS